MAVIPFYGADEPELFAIERRAMDRDGLEHHAGRKELVQGIDHETVAVHRATLDREHRGILGPVERDDAHGCYQRSRCTTSSKARRSGKATGANGLVAGYPSDRMITHSRSAGNPRIPRATSCSPIAE